MTDLEMTRLCAEAMGIAIREVSQNRPDCTLRLVSTGDNYWPIGDDAQAMVLVKKFNIGWDKEGAGEWHIALRDGEKMFWAHDNDLNRAICVCVANMQKEKP